MSQITFLINFSCYILISNCFKSLPNFHSKTTAVFHSWDFVGILKPTTATALDIATFQRQNTSNAVANKQYFYHTLFSLLICSRKPANTGRFRIFVLSSSSSHFLVTFHKSQQHPNFSWSFWGRYWDVIY